MIIILNKNDSEHPNWVDSRLLTEAYIRIY